MLKLKQQFDLQKDVVFDLLRKEASVCRVKGEAFRCLQRYLAKIIIELICLSLNIQSTIITQLSLKSFYQLQRIQSSCDLLYSHLDNAHNQQQVELFALL